MTDPRIQLIYPDRRLVSEAWIMIRWDDAVANGEVESLPGGREPNLEEAIRDLEDLGQITVSGRSA